MSTLKFAQRDTLHILPGFSPAFCFNEKRENRPTAARRDSAERPERDLHSAVSLCSPSCGENSHANHTWHPQSRKTACFV